MTSFWGYLTEGVFLLVLSVWWIVNASAEIIKCNHHKRVYVPKLSYPWPGTRIPVESVYKFFISATGFFGQLAYGGNKFYDNDGNFTSMPQLMYMTIYGLFLLHSVLDLLTWWRVPVIKGSNYAAAVTGFFWYGTALLSSSTDVMEEHVKYMVVVLPTFVLFPISLCLVLEHTWRSGSWIVMVRAFCLQTYATWCFHSAHILHSASTFPGSDPNPSWDMHDHANVTFTSAFFGLHLAINLVAMAAIYTLTAYFLRMRFGFNVNNSDDLTSSYGHARVSSSDDDVREADYDAKVTLLSAQACCG